MKFKHLANIALPVLCSISFFTSQAQTDQTNHPFSWMQTSDSWFKPTTYTYKYETDEFTPKGKLTAAHGPACTNDCRESTATDACTESLLKEKCGEVELPNARIPAGYSGVEYVTFEVQKNGKVNGYQIVKQPVLCPPCIQAAVNLVASLGEWYPAMQDGIAVKSRVVVPVYFKKGQ
ncbi:MAG: energy transducer TonB [Saprospiraceae bacterium]